MLERIVRDSPLAETLTRTPKEDSSIYSRDDAELWTNSKAFVLTQKRFLKSYRIMESLCMKGYRRLRK